MKKDDIEQFLKSSKRNTEKGTYPNKKETADRGLHACNTA
jgi:hypothetical protein